jgi:hypothetical protein
MGVRSRGRIAPADDGTPLSFSNCSVPEDKILVSVVDAVSILHNQYEALAVLAASTAVSF